MKTQHTNSDTVSSSRIPSPEAVVRRLIDEGFSLGRLEVVPDRLGVLVQLGVLQPPRR